MVAVLVLVVVFMVSLRLFFCWCVALCLLAIAKSVPRQYCIIKQRVIENGNRKPLAKLSIWHGRFVVLTKATEENGEAGRIFEITLFRSVVFVEQLERLL
jgi:hypothetical protein